MADHGPTEGECCGRLYWAWRHDARYRDECGDDERHPLCDSDESTDVQP